MDALVLYSIQSLNTLYSTVNSSILVLSTRPYSMCHLPYRATAEPRVNLQKLAPHRPLPLPHKGAWTFSPLLPPWPPGRAPSHQIPSLPHYSPHAPPCHPLLWGAVSWTVPPAVSCSLGSPLTRAGPELRIAMTSIASSPSLWGDSCPHHSPHPSSLTCTPLH